jgi:hypothetical protein
MFWRFSRIFDRSPRPATNCFLVFRVPCILSMTRAFSPVCLNAKILHYLYSRVVFPPDNNSLSAADVGGARR